MRCDAMRCHVMSSLTKAEVDEPLVWLELAPGVKEPLRPEDGRVLPVPLVVVDGVDIDQHHRVLHSMFKVQHYFTRTNILGYSRV